MRAIVVAIQTHNSVLSRHMFTVLIWKQSGNETKLLQFHSRITGMLVQMHFEMGTLCVPCYMDYTRNRHNNDNNEELEEDHKWRAK